MDYNEKLRLAKKALDSGSYDKETIEYIFPELKENEDERIKNFMIKVFKSYQNPSYHINTDKWEGMEISKILSWLEKQGEENKRLYVRFGEIPEDECSGVYHAGELVGKEEGVSVYDAKIDNHDNVLICIPLPINENTFDTLQNLIEYENRNCYLAKGTCVGKGSDNEPIIRNVSIVKRIDNYRIKEQDMKSEQNLDNSCKTYKDEQKLNPCSGTSFEYNEHTWGMCARDSGVEILIDSNLKAFISLDKTEIYPLILNKTAPKFKVGDWITDDTDTYQIVKIEDEWYITDEGDKVCFSVIHQGYHLWTIQDAKDGDVLANKYGAIFINAGSDESRVTLDSYCYISIQGEFHIEEHKTGSWFYKNDIKPATKEQRDLLFQKMKESGYEWNDEKKELKMAESVQPELPNGEDYGIDSLYHAERILEKTLGEVDGYQSDDGILEHKCAIEAVKRLYNQKPAWSEEDENYENTLISLINEIKNQPLIRLEWLKSIKERVQPQPKQEWSEEDKMLLEKIISDYTVASKSFCGHQGKLDWLKSLKERMEGE